MTDHKLCIKRERENSFEIWRIKTATTEELSWPYYILTWIPLTPFKCIFYREVEKQEIKPETIQRPQGNYALKTKENKETKQQTNPLGLQN